eukprot:m.116976 g.116976  ORF g.116976 m.116976 type:complete len:187 (-) comp16390_c0_seq11:2613-3173(-)
MISQFFILSPRGDSIVTKDYRGDVVRGTAEIFFRKLKGWPSGNPPPIFNVEGVHFLHIKRGGLFFVCTTKFNVQPTTVLELLVRIAALCKDYCGTLSEETIRRNFVLVYELLDEVIDFGYAQTTSTQTLKAYIHNEPVVVAPLETQAVKTNVLLRLGTNEKRTERGGGLPNPTCFHVEGPCGMYDS